MFDRVNLNERDSVLIREEWRNSRGQLDKNRLKLNDEVEQVLAITIVHSYNLSK